MKISILKMACGLVLVALAAAQAALGQAPDGRTWLWGSPEPPMPARHVGLIVTLMDAASTAETLQFQCAIQSKIGYYGSRLAFEVRDAAELVVSQGEQPLDVLAGANHCTIKFDATTLPLGTYRARFYLSHPRILDDASQVVILRKVNADNLLENLAAARARLASLEQALNQTGTAEGGHPYFRLKASIVADVLKKAEENGRAAEWESLEQRLRYVNRRLDAIHADIVFGGGLAERAAGVASPPLDGLAIENGGFSADGRPVFLFGAALPAPDVDALALLRRYQLNAATVTLAPDEKPGAIQDIVAQASRLRVLFDAAVTHNVSITVQFAPDQLPPDFLASHPDVKHDGRVHIGHPDVRAQWELYVAQLAPLLKGQPMLAGISLANDPFFRFSGADVQAGFLEFVRANYPDRMTLNRAWRSHLAALEDIVPWSTDPFDSYQEHRPYQFDWQTYHQSLGNAYFDWARQLVESQIPGTPLMATMADTAFTNGETRYGVHRGKLSTLLQIAGCTSVTTAEDPIYAMGYPRPSAYYALMKSFQPGQPIFNLNNVLELSPDQSPEQAYRFVHAATWEGAMCGLNGATVPMDSLIFQQPEALEGFATAALDINRLAPIVRAFQTAPADVGILVSSASKVFDDGDPHLQSALFAYEGAAFGGYNVRYVSEEQCSNGALDGLKILVIPNTPALGDEAFKKLSAYVEAGGTVARTGTPIPYNERGFSRGDLIRNTGNTVLVRGLNLPTEYLHAIDAATVLGALPQIPRAITPQGYPVEGVKTRYVEHEGSAYLYLVNMRKEPVYVSLATQTRRGHDLLGGEDIEFPVTVDPLIPMMLKLEPANIEMTVSAATDESESANK